MGIANVGSADRIIRVLVGIALIAYPLLTGLGAMGTLGIVSLIVGVVLLVTGSVSFCPLYRLLGMRTKAAE